MRLQGVTGDKNCSYISEWLLNCSIRVVFWGGYSERWTLNNAKYERSNENKNIEDNVMTFMPSPGAHYVSDKDTAKDMWESVKVVF